MLPEAQRLRPAGLFLGQTLLLFAAATLAALWRALFLRPLYLYAMATCHRVNRRGTRSSVEVDLADAR
ncbi:hypothetical protein [Streptomyces leeuwenhoekii]|uniref:Uncharacterized protein n=1 Tax=Streptomyces leeuwenhoekii TaxID=1437453 RepID=A0A0F7VS47_STRLW|nr:hypothetical protein [Streptomyces leeuwenhoekii]CQR59721.1 Hypothetical Protein sle_02590 [Streptomyces leeuwenhoekii]